MVDIDFGGIKLFTEIIRSGTRAVSWRVAAARQSEQEGREEEGAHGFILRFQRRRRNQSRLWVGGSCWTKISVDDIQPSEPEVPGIIFGQKRTAGGQILEVNHLYYSFAEWLRPI